MRRHDTCVHIMSARLLSAHAHTQCADYAGGARDMTFWLVKIQQCG